jgi:hypothetical protein
MSRSTRGREALAGGGWLQAAAGLWRRACGADLQVGQPAQTTCGDAYVAPRRKTALADLNVDATPTGGDDR